MHLTGVQRDGSRLFIRFLSRLAFHTSEDGGLGKYDHDFPLREYLKITKILWVCNFAR